MSYSNPIYATYNVAASTIATAGTKFSFQGPAGKKGRVVDISAVITTATTAAASVVSVGTSGDTDKYGLLSVPVATAGNGYSATAANLLTDQDNEIPADSECVIASDGGSTAGAADLSVIVAWY